MWSMSYRERMCGVKKADPKIQMIQLNWFKNLLQIFFFSLACVIKQYCSPNNIFTLKIINGLLIFVQC